MVTKDALQFLNEIAVQAADSKRRVLKVEAEPEHVYHLLQPDGTLNKVHAEPETAFHEAFGLETIALLAARVARAKFAEAEIWYSRTGVVLLFDRLTRRDRATLTLELSPQMARLAEWDKSRGEYPQVEFLLLLRTLFADALSAHATLRDDVKRVDFKKAQEATGTVNRANVSLSRQMISEASGADKLPDTLNFDVPAFDSAAVASRVLVRVVFDLDPQTERFRLIPIPGDVEKALAAAEESVARQLGMALDAAKAKDVPVFYGEP